MSGETVGDAVIELNTPPLPYYLGSGLTEFRIGDHHPNRRKLGIYDLLIMVKGELHIGENGQRWTLTAGDTLLLLPNGEHYAVKPCEQDTVFYWVHFEHAGRYESSPATNTCNEGVFHSSHSSRPFGNPYTLRLPKHSQLSNPQAAFSLVQQLLALPMDHSFWEEQRLLAELLAMLEEEGGLNGVRSASARLAERVAAYIQQNYRDKITSETLAAVFHFHPNYIIRCMKMKYSRTPTDYLHDYRLERAKRLLITTDWSVERISEEVGYRNAPYFSSSFKHSAGLSPLQFRKQYMN
ncbi:helix-turn-helix transcriptional regulator [Paenibacillus medicaginis]|uniref:AraC family transcriptional regulator n=1 Tax=Paenibacillus medicaginis TaxID=1470560 RepID=A0ABV5CAC4_9BACL